MTTVEILKGANGVDRTVRSLLDGDCVALPTETVYGLAADAGNEQAVKAIFAAKGRPSDHPLIVHLSSPAQLRQWAKTVPDIAWQLADAFWPGPLTLLLNKADHVSAAVTGGLPTIALRVPAHPLFQEVLKQSGLGLAAPSANRYKKLSPTTAKQVARGMAGHIKAVLDGGPCEFGLESTIVDVTRDTATILRAGPISRAMLEDVLMSPVAAPENHNVAVPGNVEAHYQPDVPLRLATLENLEECDDPDAGFLIWSESALLAVPSERAVLRMPENPSDYGRKLYAVLSELSDQGVSKILVETPPEEPAWSAINDRLRRAAGPKT